jgi:RNA polymerase-binding transcription factor DksA
MRIISKRPVVRETTHDTTQLTCSGCGSVIECARREVTAWCENGGLSGYTWQCHVCAKQQSIDSHKVEWKPVTTRCVDVEKNL